MQMHSFGLFLAAALVLAITPGPGIFYVLTRTLAGGRRDGILSAGGTLLGGMVHVFAAALGISAVLAASALAFAVVKYAGAGYLIYMGIRMIRSRALSLDLTKASPLKAAGTFRQGIATEVLNPKTALFFLSFIPQFIHPERGHVFAQFVTLGLISVTLNTSADIGVAFLAGTLGGKLKQSTRLIPRQRLVSGLAMIGLGIYVAATGEPK